MNNIFKIIFSQSLQRLVVVSELAKGRAKAKSSTQVKEKVIARTFKKTLLSSLLASLFITPVFAQDPSDVPDDPTKIPAEGVSSFERPEQPMTIKNSLHPAGMYVEGWNFSGLNTVNQSSDTNSANGGVQVGIGAQTITKDEKQKNRIGVALKVLEGAGKIRFPDYAEDLMDSLEEAGKLTTAKRQEATEILADMKRTPIDSPITQNLIDKFYTTIGLTELEKVKYSIFFGDFNIAVGANAKAQALNGNALALGHNATVETNGEGATAIGYKAKASAENAIALGTEAKAKYEKSLAMGFNTEAGGDDSISLGTEAKTMSNETIAIGKDALAGGQTGATHGAGIGAIAIGSGAKAPRVDSVAIGRGAQATPGNNGDFIGAVAIGANAQALATDSIAIGRNAHTADLSKNNAIVIGVNSEVANNAIAIGSHSNAFGDTTIAIGRRVKSSGNNSITMGLNSQTGKGYGVTIGGDAITTGYKDMKASWGVTVGDHAQNLGGVGVVIGSHAFASEKDFDFDNSPEALTQAQYEAEINSGKSESDFIKIFKLEKRNDGSDNFDEKIKYIRLSDYGALTYDTAVGYKAKIIGKYSNAVGAATKVTSDLATVVGYRANTAVENSVAIGALAQATEAVNTPTSAMEGVTFGQFAGTSENGKLSSFSVGNKKYTRDGGVDVNEVNRQIQNVGAGQISETSTDAINGSQLFTVAKSIIENSPIDYGLKMPDGTLKLGAVEKVGDKYYEMKDGKPVYVSPNAPLPPDDDIVTAYEGKDGGIYLKGADGKYYINPEDLKNGKNGIPESEFHLYGKRQEVDPANVVARVKNTGYQVATLNDGLIFAGNDEQDVERKLNTKLNIKGEGVDKTQAGTFASAEGNINVKKADENGLEIQLAKDLKGIDSIAKKDGAKITLGADHIALGDTTNADKPIQIKNVKAGVADTDAVNKAQLWKPQVNGAKVKDIGENNILNFINGDNIALTIENGQIKVATIKTPTFDSANFGATQIDEGGLTIANGPTLRKDNVDMHNNQIHNVKAGTANEDAVNLKQLTDKFNEIKVQVDGIHTKVDVDHAVVFTTLDGDILNPKDGKYYKQDQFAEDGSGDLKPDATPYDGRIQTRVVNPNQDDPTVDGSTHAPIILGNVASSIRLHMANEKIKEAKDQGNTLNLKDALKNIDDNTTAKERVDYLAKKNAGASHESNYKTVNMQDLTDVVIAGLDFVGNDESEIHRNLAETLKVEGEGVDKAKATNFKSAEGNIAIVGNNAKDGLLVKLSSELQNIDSIAKKDGVKITLGTDHIALGDATNQPVNIKNVKAGEADTDAVNMQQLKDLTIAYKANNGTAKTVKLKDGLNFVDGQGTRATVDENGVVKIDLNKDQTSEMLKDTFLKVDGSNIGDKQNEFGKNVGIGEIGQALNPMNENKLVQVKLLKDYVQGAYDAIDQKNFGLMDSEGNEIYQHLEQTIQIVGANGIVTEVDNGALVVKVGPEFQINGENGKDGNIAVKGLDGQSGVTINGKDGISVAGQNGKDAVSIKAENDNGVITLNGHDGNNGRNGKDVTANIQVMNGTDGIDGVDGTDARNSLAGHDGMTRIVYKDKDANAHEVATLDDGLIFAGNDEQNVERKLNTKLTIKGEGVDKTQSGTFASAKGNINVKADGNGLEIQLAKDLKGIDSVSNGNAKITLDGASGNVNLNDHKLTNLADGDVNANSQDAVTGRQLHEVKEQLDQVKNQTLNHEGFKLAGDSGNAIQTKLKNDYEVKVVGAKDADNHQNIKVTADSANNELQVALNDDVKVKNSVTIGDGENKVEIKDGGVTVGDGENKVTIKDGAVTIGDGDDDSENKVTIKDGHVDVTGTDGANGNSVVNVDYLNDRLKPMENLNNRVTALNDKVETYNKDLRAGIAGATALAFLQRPNVAGKSMVSAAVGGYKGQHALAVGYARNSDNNKVSFKVGVGVNSRNDVNYGASLGYQW